MKKSYIWSLPTRAFHWLFVLFIFLSFITADEDRWLNFHALMGYAVLILLFFRLSWGVLGPKYSKFKDFPISKDNLKEFLSNIFDAKQKFIGHNPLASYVMISMFIVIFLIILSGSLTLGIQEGKGLFSSLNISMFKEMKLFKEIHEVLSSLLILLIVAHLSGIIFDKFFHGEHETLESIFTGYKKIQKEEFIKLNIFQKIISLLFLILFIGFFVFSFLQPNNILVSSIYKPINYEKQNELFVRECGSCHTLYPPNLLPTKSWTILMENLDNHFGDDASLEKDEESNILSFLIRNSAETSSMEASKKILDSIEKQDIIAISQTSFWKEVHSQIPNRVFKHEKIKSKANCKVCHIDIEKGLIEDEKIKDINTII